MFGGTVSLRTAGFAGQLHRLARRGFQTVSVVMASTRVVCGTALIALMLTALLFTSSQASEAPKGSRLGTAPPLFFLHFSFEVVSWLPAWCWPVSCPD